ncbi:MAG TPA: ABC transporter permease [Solirubrobacteraceae bacterium]
MSAGDMAVEGGAQPRAAGRSLDQRVFAAYQTELLKLGSQLAVRLLVLVCAIGPFAFSALLKVQSGTPADALFGAYVHSSGFAVSLVVMGFAGQWGFPLIAGLVAGDQFASEDRHNTWKTILTRSCSLGELFTGKLLAAATVAVAMLVLAMASSLLAGLVLVGGHGVVDLSGSLQSAGRSLALTIVSWALCVLPLLAYVSLAALFSVASRNGIVGVVGPIVIALATTLIDLIGKGVWVHLLLIGSAFGGMYGLFTDHPFLGPLVITSLVSLVWIAGCLGAAWLILRRRDFLAGSSVRAPSWHAPLRVVAATTVIVAVLAVASNLGPVGITQQRLNAAVGAAFNNVSLLQQRLIGRLAPAGAKLDVQPFCNRRGAKSQGPGDWLCNVYVYLPQLNAVPFQRTNVEYDVSVRFDGCYKAQSPPTFIGGSTMTDNRGRSVVNPLFVVYGCFNTL